MKDWVFFCLTLHSPPSKTCCEAHSGRFSGLRIVLLGPKSSFYFRPPCPFPPCPFDKLRASDSGSGKFRTRLQRRGRPRISRGSLFGLQPPERESNFTYYISQFLSGCQIKKQSGSATKIWAIQKKKALLGYDLNAIKQSEISTILQ